MVRIGVIDNSKSKETGLSHFFNSFFKNEATGGILLLICAIVAVALASFPQTRGFDDYFNNIVSIGGENFNISMPIRHWINDGLMTIFFLSVGLEIKREMIFGQLSSLKKSILPIMGAIGGMIVPACIYAIFNHGNPETSGGWGIPMATDIAFAVGILAILGNKVPLSLKVFLTALAVADDLGAIIVLAIFYPSHSINFVYLGIVFAITLALFFMGKFKIRHALAYIIPGIFMWYFTYKSGVHATISGVLLAMTIPSTGTINELKFTNKFKLLFERFKETTKAEVEVLASPEQQELIHCMNVEIDKVDPLLHKLESKLHPIVNFLIMPLFALANAGVALNFDIFANGIPTAALGISLGLLIGKPLGIFLMSALSIKLGLASQPDGVKLRELFSIGILGGIGFTMSIFVNGLAFTDSQITDVGKISILITSATVALIGYLVLLASYKRKTKKQI